MPRKPLPSHTDSTVRAAPITSGPLPETTRTRRPDAAVWMQMQAFRDLPDATISRLEEVMVSRTYASGEVLLQQDAPGDGLLVLESGSVLVTVAATQTTGPFERSLNAPQILGEAAVLTGERRTATVTAVTPCQTRFVDRDTLRALCSRFPPVAEFLTTLVGERLMASGSIRRVGKYEVRGRLGSGGVATVFSAFHPELGRTVALKMLSHALLFERSFADHFAEEARIVARLDHENIVRVYDTETAYGTQFIVMERLYGDELRTPVEGGEMLAWPSIRRILRQLADALAYSHAQGLVHRDIKPSNVFMTRDGRAKLLDFGIATQRAHSSAVGGKVMGTPAYMSPEQAMGLALDGRSDQYALGLIAYELCTGKRPFAATRVDDMLRAHASLPVPDPGESVADLPGDLHAFILRTTEKRPEDRFPSCVEAADLLRQSEQFEVDEQGVATLALSFPVSQREQVAALLEEFSERVRHIRGARVAMGVDTVSAAHSHDASVEPPALDRTRADGRATGARLLNTTEEA